MCSKLVGGMLNLILVLDENPADIAIPYKYHDDVGEKRKMFIFIAWGELFFEIHRILKIHHEDIPFHSMYGWKERGWRGEKA